MLNAQTVTTDSRADLPYSAILSAAWQSHLAPRSENAPKVISTFAGAGGSSLGYSMAGYQELLAVEWDDNAAATLKRNFPKVLVYHGDISALSVHRVLEMTGLEPGELDVFDGSPPCQGFSTAGRRNLDDPRNQLFRDYVRLLRGLQPKAFVMENVAGMIKGKMKLIFAEALQELKSCGYQVSVRVVNMSYYQVPQARIRLIFMGVRNDLNIKPSFPSATSWPIVVRDALEDVQNDQDELQMLLEAGKRYSAYREWHLIPPGKSRADVMADGNGFSANKFDPYKPAPTILKTEGNIGMHGSMHWKQRRRFTVAEYKRLFSFPDEFIFEGTWGDAVQRLGNSVPPLFMKNLATHIRAHVLEAIQPERGGG